MDTFKVGVVKTFRCAPTKNIEKIEESEKLDIQKQQEKEDEYEYDLW